MPELSPHHSSVKCRSFAGYLSTDDGKQTINAQWIREQLIERGLIGANRKYTIEPISGGLNSRVFIARRPGNDPELTIRLRDRQDRSAAEVDGLSDAAGCPGVPSLRLLTHELLVLDYLPGERRAFGRLNQEQIQQLGSSLACIHSTIYNQFTPWPERSLRTGDRADLLRFRIDSLAGYESYTPALSGEIHPGLPELIAGLAEPVLADPSWDEHDFARLHGDLSIGNVLWRGDTPSLIDWEYSRVGDPAEDLAYLLIEQAAGFDHGRPLQRAYIEADGDPDAWDRVPVYALFTAVDSALWWADYATSHVVDARDEIDRRISAGSDWLTHIGLV